MTIVSQRHATFSNHLRRSALHTACFSRLNESVENQGRHLSFWMRNAATHFRRRYIPQKDAFEMWDNSVPPQAITVDELLEIGRRMYQISGETIQRVARLHALRTLFGPTGFRDELVESFPLLLSGNLEEAKRVDDKFTAKTEEMVRPVADFFSAHITKNSK